MRLWPLIEEIEHKNLAFYALPGHHPSNVANPEWMQEGVALFDIPPRFLCLQRLCCLPYILIQQECRESGRFIRTKAASEKRQVAA